MSSPLKSSAHSPENPQTEFHKRQRSGTRLLPGITVMRSYKLSWLRGDLLAGVTVAAYLVPQVMAYAVIAGLPPVVGLWAVLAPMVIYFFLGTSRKLSIGPESTTALMTAAGVGALVGATGAAGAPQRYAEVAALLAIATGVVCLIAAIGRLGFVSRLLSRPVLIGYLIGIAMLMIISQLSKVTKVQVQGENSYQEIHSFLSQIRQIHLPTLILAVVILVALFAGKRFLPNIPSALGVLLLAAITVAVFQLQQFGIEVIGEVPDGLPQPQLPHLGDLQLWTLFPYAIGIAIVGFSDNILTARAFVAEEDEPINPNQELLALGAANIANGFVQGFPVSSSGSRTVLGVAAGARSQVHSLVVIAVVILVLLFAGPVLQNFPQAALGALVIYAATQLINVAEVRRIAQFRRSELVLTLVTAGAVVVLGVLNGIGVAIAFSILDLIRRITRPNADVLGFVPGIPGMHSIEDYPNATTVPGLVVFRYDSPLFFANADDFYTRALQAVDASPQPVHWFLLNAEANTEVDLTAVDALEKLRKTLHERGIRFTMARVKMELSQNLQPTGFLEHVGKQYIFATLPTAVAAYEQEFPQK
ncbi:SulP family inorganic anion transporter [Corynebacterium callunae]|uniref:SulP family inorganic anion transporter n=1 Tax=Corynebacterium callunae TaxID=1721 RepID=UPI000AF00AA2|nr:SulP family inorganic anion transporter [Corynebacterium callunae]